MTDQNQTTPAETTTAVTEADASLDGLIAQARTTPQGIVALLFAYAQELASDSDRKVAGVVLASTDADGSLQAHMVSAVDGVSMARLLNAQADALDTPKPPTILAADTEAQDPAGSASPWHPEDDDAAVSEPTA